MKKPKLYIDIETYSPIDVTKLGVYRHSEHPDFRILMAFWALDDGPVQAAIGHDAIKAIPGLFDPTVLKVAHNAGFERVCLSTLVSLPRTLAVADPDRPVYLNPEEWHDTQAIAAEQGYPQKLGPLAKALGVEEKDEAGTRLINLFSKPNRGKRVLPEERPAEWLEFQMYCAQDVETLREVDEELGDWPNEAERQAWIADQHINDRGLRVDLEMVEAATAAAAENQAKHEQELKTLTGLDNPNSVQQLGRWLREQGLKVPNLQKETVERLARNIKGDPRYVHVSRVLELRQELALVAAKKYEAALLGTSEDGRLRGQFRFFGAHTGRWAGRGVQPHNLPRETLGCDQCKIEHQPDRHVNAAIMDLLLGNGADALTLKALVRSMFTGPFTVVDYSAIEARVIAWLAGEQWALDAFRAGRDIYVETAKRMSTPGHEMTRHQGKVAVLALGYQGSIGSLLAMGAQGSDAELEKLVFSWRAANQKIVGLWKALEDAFKIGGPVGEHLHVSTNGSDRAIRLPSGRHLEYHGVQLRRSQGRSRLSYLDPKRAGLRIDTYGGKLSENVTQAVARDLLSSALVRLRDVGYDVVGHVHDEAIIEGTGSQSVQVVTKLMCDSPAWAAGLPVAAEGFTCDRYRKG